MRRRRPGQTAGKVEHAEHGVIPQPVVDEGSLTTSADQAGPPENGELLRDVRTRPPQHGGEVAGAGLIRAKRGNKSQAGRMGERLQKTCLSAHLGTRQPGLPVAYCRKLHQFQC